MNKIDELFKKYRVEILKNEKYLKKIHEGELPVIQGYEEIDDIISFFNKAQEKYDWGQIFHEKFARGNEYGIHSTLSSFIRPLINAENKLFKEYAKYVRNYEYFNKQFNKIKSKLSKSIKEDSVENQKRVERGRMNDMSTGVFSHEEASNRAMFNSFINVYRSDKTIALSTLLQDTYDQFFSYFYMKLEYISSLAIGILPQNKKRIQWTDKYKEINNLPLGQKISKPEYKRIMDVANHYKHQTILMGYLPTIDELNDFLNTIVDKLKLNLDFKAISDSIDSLSDEIDNILNPLGLTGME